MLKQLVIAGSLALAAASSQSATLLSQNFDSFAAALADGWTRVNLSSPAGDFGWGQAYSPSVVTAHSGDALSYAQSNWDVASTAGGVVDNWLMTPTITFAAQNTLTFWSRTTISPSAFVDRMEVRVSTAGSSTDAASFSTLLLTINPDLTATGYPAEWTLYTVNFSAVAGSSGRFAFRATMPDNTAYSDMIALDDVMVTSVPEPGTTAMLLLGIGAVAARVRRQSR